MKRVLALAAVAVVAVSGSAVATAASATGHRDGKALPRIEIKLSPHRYLRYSSADGLSIRVTVTGSRGRAHGHIDVTGTGDGTGFTHTLLDHGRASFSGTGQLAPVGRLTVTVRYHGSRDYRPRTAHASIDVIPSPTNTAVTMSPLTGVQAGRPVTLGVQLYGEFGSPAHGFVAFRKEKITSDGGSVDYDVVDIPRCGHVPVDSLGSASCSTTFKRGRQELYFDFLGSPNYSPSEVSLYYKVRS